MAIMIIYFCIIYYCCLNMIVDSKLVECTEGYVRCADNTKCIADTQLCDYKKDCDDLSDERISLCKVLNGNNVGNCRPGGNIYTPHGCQRITSVCKLRFGALSTENSQICNEIKGGLKPSEEYAAIRKEKPNLEELFSRLAASFNESTRIKNNSVCPPLYVDIGSKCVAIFLVAEVTWAEAKQFCESISGTLATIRKLKDYDALLRHFKTHDLATNFWIGGIHHTKPDNSSSWMWLDENEIIMGAPYWSVYHTTNCTLREGSNHCYNYAISPRENTDGYCLSMDYEFHYYFSDRSCFEKRKPICYLNEK